MHEVTRVLQRIQHGDASASERLLPLVYEELKKLAEVKLAHEASGLSLQPTVLVHEAYLRLVDVKTQPQWNSRGHFFGAAAEAMRRILVERARRKRSTKHGEGWQRISLDDVASEVSNPDVDLVALDEALMRLEERWPKKAQLVKLRYFAGLTLSQCANAMEISQATAERYWTFSKAWLLSELKPG